MSEPEEVSKSLQNPAAQRDAGFCSIQARQKPFIPGLFTRNLPLDAQDFFQPASRFNEQVNFGHTGQSRMSEWKTGRILCSTSNPP
jgi:hypothetical protein